VELPLIRLSKATVGAEEVQALTRVIEDGYLGMAKEVQALEVELQEFIGSKPHVVCVNTGTSALHLALQACGIGPGDEVLVPTLTYLASFQAVSATGAKPVACDVDSETGFLDGEDAKKRITPRTKAIMPVHYASNLYGLDSIYDLSKSQGLRVIEDAAHSFGGRHGTGERVGSRGDVVCFSFDSIKNITCGEGGAVITQDIAVANHVRDARLLGVEKDTEKRFSGQRSWDFDTTHQGWRYHMSDVMAAIGRCQLKKVDGFVEKRQQLAQQYQDFFQNDSCVRTFPFDYTTIAPHIFPIFLKYGCRDNLRAFLLQHNIQTGLHYKLNHTLSLFKTSYALPKAESLFAGLLTLPLHPTLSSADVARVCETICLWKKSL
jgi:dTDP-4-amino-4,6-dideoxygalactose transaminase